MADLVTTCVHKYCRNCEAVNHAHVTRIAALEAQLAASEARCAELRATIADCDQIMREKESENEANDKRARELISAALARAEEAERVKDELLLAVSALMKAFDDGIFVRDTSNDHRPDWSIRLSNPLRALAVLREASDAALRQAMGVRGDE